MIVGAVARQTDGRGSTKRSNKNHVHTGTRVQAMGIGVAERGIPGNRAVMGEATNLQAGPPSCAVSLSLSLSLSLALCVVVVDLG